MRMFSQVLCIMFLAGLLLTFVGAVALPGTPVPTEVKNSKTLEGKGVKITLLINGKGAYIQRVIDPVKLGAVEGYIVMIERLIGPNGEESFRTVTFAGVKAYSGADTDVSTIDGVFGPGKYTYILEIYLITGGAGDRIANRVAGSLGRKMGVEHARETAGMIGEAVKSGVLLFRGSVEYVVEEQVGYYTPDNGFTRLGLAMMLPTPLIMLDRGGDDKKKKAALT